MIQASFKQFSSKFQVSFTEVSIYFQGYFKEVKEVSRAFQSFFKEVFKDSLKHINSLSSLFSCCCMSIVAASRAEGGLVFFVF